MFHVEEKIKNNYNTVEGKEMTEQTFLFFSGVFYFGDICTLYNMSEETKKCAAKHSRRNFP